MTHSVSSNFQPLTNIINAPKSEDTPKCNICPKLADFALENLNRRDLPGLRHVGCENLAPLAGMRLTNLNLRRCDQITDAGLAHLRMMPIEDLIATVRPSVAFDGPSEE